MLTDPQTCMTAVRSRDARFDGWFVTGVRTTGIYCRPSCPATPPKARNITFYPSAAAAQASGFRACKRCRPDASPGSPEWNARADLVARAMRLIADGVVDREGVEGLSRRLGYSTRQIERQIRAELGASPLALARAQRAQTARILIETTTLPLTQVAHASGFGSIRSFNATVREVFAMAPRELRLKTRPPAGHASAKDPWHHLQLRLPFRRPLRVDNLFGHLVATAVPGVEEWRDGAYRRTLQLPHGPAVVALRPDDGYVAARVWLRDLADLPVAISRSRWLLDLDADPAAIDEHLSGDPALAALVARAPGRRVPRTVDGKELALRLVLGQQISTRAARTHAARLVQAYGEPLDDPAGGSLTATFPEAAVIATASDETLAMPQSRRATLRGLAAALADGAIDVSTSADWDDARRNLLALPGIGPWTVEGVAMRALGDPDAFLATDLGVRQALSRLGIPRSGRAVVAATEPWRPWRAYAVQHLWASIPHEINQLPEQTRSAS